MGLDLADFRAPARKTIAAALDCIAHGEGVLMVGRAAAIGPTMLARRIATALPPLTDGQQQQVTNEFKRLSLPPPQGRPLRCPHHTVSGIALSAEALLARFGVLYLDDLPLFRMGSLSMLRSALSCEQQGAPILIASATACACGQRGPRGNRCDCSADSLRAWERTLSSVSNAMGMGIVTAPDVSLRKLKDSERGRTSREWRNYYESLCSR